MVEGPGCGRPEWFCGTDLGGEEAGRQNQPRVCGGHGGRGCLSLACKVTSGAVLCFRKRERAVKWRRKCHIGSDRK